MNDDFNTREAIAVLFQFSRFVNGFELELLTKAIQEEDIGFIFSIRCRSSRSFQ